MDIIIETLVVEEDRPAHIAKHNIKNEVFLLNLLCREVGKMIKIKKVKRHSIKPIEPFRSLEEEANFWDTHSVVDKIDEGTVVGFHQANKTHTITIRFQPKYLQILREKAFKLGIGPTTLARMWLMNKLEH